MNYVQKNRRNILLISGGVIILVALLIWALQNKGYTSEDMVGTVTPNSVNVEEPVNFEDKTPFGKTRKWVFGDGAESTDQKAIIKYH